MNLRVTLRRSLAIPKTPAITTKVPYLYNATTSQFISYNDPRTIAAKATYAQQTGLGGLFFWQIMSDVPIDNPNSLIAVVGI
jgi:chitinase